MELTQTSVSKLVYLRIWKDEFINIVLYMGFSALFQGMPRLSLYILIHSFELADRATWIRLSPKKDLPSPFFYAMQ